MRNSKLVLGIIMLIAAAALAVVHVEANANAREVEATSGLVDPYDSFPVADTSTLIFDDWLAIIETIKDGDLEQIRHIALERFGIAANDPEAEGKLAQVLNAVEEIYTAGGLVESLDLR